MVNQQNGRDSPPLASAAETTVLIDAFQRLSLARSVADIQELVCGAARRLTGADGATFILREGELCHCADEDAIGRLWKGRRLPLNDCVSGWVMANRQAVAIPDVYADDRIRGDAYRPTFVKSLAMVPIRTLAPIGAIGSYWAAEHEATDEELSLLQALADSTAVAMETVRLWQELEQRLADSTTELAERSSELEETNAGVRELMDEAAERGEDLRATVEHHRNLLNSLAHEVRSPLTACDLLLDELLSDRGLDGPAAENVIDARKCIAEVVRIVEAQLQRARLEAGAIRPRADVVKVSELYLALRGMVRALRRSSAVALEFDAPDDLPPIHTDPHMLGQILRNLIGNALKFTDEGFVRVSAAFDPVAGSFTFTVSDTGLGIDEGDRRRIFEDFGQVSTAQRPGRSGTGLGLPLSRTLAIVLGGSLELAEAGSDGSSFVVTLPARMPAAGIAR